jgi:dimethylhistidine N-methyltransferase
MSIDATRSRFHAVPPQVQRQQMRREVLHGLRQRHKSLPCKYFYDEKGSQLFDRICGLPEYYLTRTEQAIMREHLPEMAEAIGPEAMLIEYGSGSSVKTRQLLDALPSPAAYVPIDISREHLLRSAEALGEAYPGLEILPVAADYTEPLEIPQPSRPARRRVVYFPGSTIGNFEPIEARQFLRQVARVCGGDGGLLIGVDLKKDPAILHAAYNDAEGVTAAFNRNVLARLNSDLQADFAPDRFDHYAFYNPRLGRIEMHLVSRGRQVVTIGETFVTFSAGESIHTESSYKHTVEGFARLAGEAGFRRRRSWVDARRWFAVLLFQVS